MTDPYLEIMLKNGGLGIVAEASKDRFDVAAEKWIEDQLNLIDFESECAGNKLVTPAIKRAQKKTELQNELKKEEKGELLTKASTIIHTEGMGILGDAQYKKVIEAFQTMKEKLDALSLEGDLTKNYQTLLDVDDTTIEVLEKIAIFLFANARYADCLAVSTLLSTLVPGNANTIYRSAMAAQNDGDIALALELYALALEINPTLIGAHLFTAECHLSAGELSKAEASLTKAKTCIQENPPDPVWINLLNQLEKWFHENS